VGTTTVDPSWPEAQMHRRRQVNYDNRSLDYNDNDDGDGDDDDDDESVDIWDRMENRVPFGVVIMIFFGYISLGGLMFTRFENWSMRESVYFCYITLATVGFGDYVSVARFSIEFNV
jgi:hypothetical protein